MTSARPTFAVAALIASLAMAGQGAEAPSREPSCVRPVAVEGPPGDLGYIVMFVRDVADAETSTAELGRRYGFNADAIFTTTKGFAVASLTSQALAGLRCEPTIRRIFYNQPLRISAL